ncbi:MAG: hypothetical protein HC799_05655 [Limnothrix sp. RL_2_0]|nr:hypothetical protein [Limnothrix sp. RL_2_0]
MGTQSLNQTSTGDRVTMAVMAALVMFVAGYTASRMVLAEVSLADNVAATHNVIPHEGEMWRAFGE